MTSSVYLVRFLGCDSDVWDTMANAKRAAAMTISDLMSEEDEERFSEDLGIAFDDASDGDLIKWWNDNRNIPVIISEHKILTFK